jgi:hypothetical protein
LIGHGFLPILKRSAIVEEGEENQVEFAIYASIFISIGITVRQPSRSPMALFQTVMARSLRVAGRADADVPGQRKDRARPIVIPQEALDRIAGMASPRSSLIISDEALSAETAKARISWSS